MHVREDIVGMGSTLFTKATGALINKKVRDGYEMAGGVADSLVTTVPSNLKTETLVGFTGQDSLEEVLELQHYPSGGMQEIYFTATNKKYGKIIGVSEECIKFDQTGQILSQAARIGEKARIKKEQLIIEGIDVAINTTDPIFKPLGADAILYKSTARTTLAQGGKGGANAVTGYADIDDAALNAIMTMAAEQYDENGDYINIGIQGWNILCPWELYKTAWEVVQTPLTPFSNDNAKNFWQSKFIPVWSPFLTTSTVWYVGDFKKDFIWLEVFPLQVQRLMRGTDVEFTRDMVAAFRVRFMGAPMAIDYRHVYRVA
jgi:hypothetical protein